MNKKIKLGLLLTAAVLLGTTVALALPQYLAPLQSLYGSGLSCGTCHVNPAGGGPLTAYGSSFAAVPTHSTDPSGALCSIGAPPGATTSNCPPTPTGTFNISGFKINQSSGSGIPNWNITVTNATMQQSTLTGTDGSYKFTGLVNGS